MGSGAEQSAVGIVVERRASANRWRPWYWRAVEIVPDLPGGATWRLLMQGAGWVRYAAAGIVVEPDIVAPPPSPEASRLHPASTPTTRSSAASPTPRRAWSNR